MRLLSVRFLTFILFLTGCSEPSETKPQAAQNQNALARRENQASGIRNQIFALGKYPTGIKNSIGGWKPIGER